MDGTAGRQVRQTVVAERRLVRRPELGRETAARLAGEPGALAITVDPRAGTLTIRHDAALLPPARLRELLRAQGLLGGPSWSETEREAHGLLVRLAPALPRVARSALALLA